MACSCNKTNSAQPPAVQNRVFLNKIFFEGREASCPLIYNLLTDEANFTQTLSLGERNCCGCGINCDSHFTVTNTCVTVNSLALSDSSAFTAANVTVDGFNITNLTYEDGLYVADLSGIMSDITKCPCAPVDRHLCGGCGVADNCPGVCENNGNFFLAETSGTWEAMVTIALEGYVTTNGRTCDFKLTFKSRPNTFVAVPGNNNFAVNCVEIPCRTQGISPNLMFSFEGCGVLLNPEITLTESTSETDAACEDSINLTLTASLVLTPNVFLQVIRPSLFALNATEICVPCDDVGQCDAYNAVYGSEGSGNGSSSSNSNGNSGSCGCGCSGGSSSNSGGCGCSGTNTSSTRRGGRLGSAISGIACQCCDTNGYHF